jgi:hypothetical protein
MKKGKYCNCAADAAIWTEQQLVAIPGWLREDQNARLHEEHLASIKGPRLPITKKNKARRTITAGEGGQNGENSAAHCLYIQHLSTD